MSSHDQQQPDEDESDYDLINRLVLELSLVTSLPVNSKGRDFIRASAAANAMASRTLTMNKKDLRNFEWIIEPLMRLLLVDIEDPVAVKTALVLQALMQSRICMAHLINCGGLANIGKVLDILLSKRTSELMGQSSIRSLVENLGVVYREVARFHPWTIVEVGGLRHCVALLRFGDVTLQTVSAVTLSSLSSDLEICKQMFAYGAIKPLLNSCDADLTNDACMLAGLGCITQLCRIPEIALRLVQQGCVPVLERALHRHSGHNHLLMREKAIFGLGFLSRIDTLKVPLCTVAILSGLQHEFFHGTVAARAAILQILMNLHRRYTSEQTLCNEIRETIMVLITTAPWHVRNLCLKAICVLYNDDDQREWFVAHGLIDAILYIVTVKNTELQEAPLVAILSLCSHPDIPVILLKKGIAKVAAHLLTAQDPVIKELAVIVLKALLLYNSFEVTRVTPNDQSYLLERDLYNPQLFGAEYGGLIQEYLQTIVENRREQDYLIRQFTAEEVQQYKLTEEELNGFQNTFMEIDAECAGVLGVDELKLLMVMMGEVMDKLEIEDLLDEYDTDRSGNLDFKEFVVMMKGWKDRFGHGLTRFVNITTKRGAIGKSMRLFSKWWNKDKAEAAQIAESKARAALAKGQKIEQTLAYLPHELLKVKREQMIRFREMERQEAMQSRQSSFTHLQSGGRKGGEGGGSVASSTSSLTFLPPIQR